MAKRNEPKFDSLLAVKGNRTALEAVCRQHWPKQGAIRTTARRESALACAIVVLRALFGTIVQKLRAGPVLNDLSHPLFEAASVLDTEKSMRLAAAATRPDNDQSDFLAIMEQLSFVEKSFWSMPYYGQLFQVDEQSYVGVDKAEAKRREDAHSELTGMYASKGMLIIKPSHGDDSNPRTLHDAVQQAYEKVIAAAPSEVSAGCRIAPMFVRLRYDGRMGFEKLCFALDVAETIKGVDGHLEIYPTKRWYYQCIAAVCLTSEVHTVTLWNRKAQIQAGPPYHSPWWAGEKDGTSPVGDGTYMLYFAGYTKSHPNVVNQLATTATEHLADNHGPADLTSDAQLRSKIEGESRDRMTGALRAANEQKGSALSTAQEAHQNEVQDLQDKLQEQATERKGEVESLNKERDELARQLSDATAKIAAQATEANQLQKQMRNDQLVHNGTVDGLTKTHCDAVRSLTKSIRDDLRSEYEAKEDELVKRFGERIRECSSVQKAQSPKGKRSADDAELDESERNSRPRKRARIPEPASFGELVERTSEQLLTLPENIECLEDVCGNRPSLGEIFQELSYMTVSPRSFSYLDTFFVQGIANQWHCLRGLLRQGDQAARLDSNACAECNSECLIIRLVETEDEDAVEAIQFTFSDPKSE